MATLATPAPLATTTPSHVPFRALAVVGGVLLTLGVTLSPMIMFDSAPYSEIVVTAPHLVLYGTWMLCLVVLSQVLPRFGGMPGPSGRRVSTAAATAAGVGATLKAGAWFLLAFGNPSIAAHAPQMLDSSPDAIILVSGIGAELAAMIGTVWLAVSARRAGVFPRHASLLLILAAVAVPVAGPLSNAPLGLALLWIGIVGPRRP